MLGGDDAGVQSSDAHVAFIAEIQRTLKADDLRLISLAGRVLDEPGQPEEKAEELGRLRIEVMKADGEYQYATQKAEIAEMELKELTQATLPQELAEAEAQLGIAQADLVRAQAYARQAKRELEKLTTALDEEKASFGLELARSNKEVLVKYKKDQRTKEREAQLTKARSVERAKKAEWELLKGRLDEREKPATADPVRPEAIGGSSPRSPAPSPSRSEPMPGSSSSGRMAGPVPTPSGSSGRGSMSSRPSSMRPKPSGPRTTSLA